ncbi:MAG: ABC transporter ATP-binding protein [Bacillota bacterium]
MTATTTTWAIRTEDLRRTFRDKSQAKKKGANSASGAAGAEGDKRAKPQDFVALDGINLEVREGELFGLLGPNGAGKTTLIKILATLMYPTTGRAWVCGYDVKEKPGQVKKLINMVSGGEHSGYGALTVRETLWMFSQFYGLDSREALRRIDELMEVIGFKDQANTKISKLSTGMRQKMNFIRGFISDPRVLFLDEPTLGLDVSVSKTIRQFVKDWVKARPDRTVLLTTHYMAEADEMCDRVAIIDSGRVLACDSPDSLKRSLGRDSAVELELANGEGVTESGLTAIPGVRRAALQTEAAAGKAEATLIIEEDGAVQPLLGYVADCGAKVLAFRKKEVTLEDVFLSIVGRKLDENGNH